MQREASARAARAAVALSLLGAVSLSGCYRSAGSPVDGSMSDGSPPDADAVSDASVPGADAAPDACVPVLDVETDCTLRWARAFAATEGLRLSAGQLAVADGSVAVRLNAASGARMTVAGVELRSTGRDFVVVMDAAGAPRWALDGRGDGLAIDSVRVLSNAGRHREEAVEAHARTDGALVFADALGAGWMRSFVGLACADCEVRTVREVHWDEAVDLGPLGDLRGVAGMSLVDVRDGRPTWHWTVTDEAAHELTVRWPETTASANTLTVAVANGDHEHPEDTVCLSDEVCLRWYGPSRSALVRLAADGAVTWMRALEHPVLEVHDLADGGVLFTSREGVTRLDASGEPMWHRGGLDAWANDVALDPATNTVWVAVGIPLDTLSVAGATVRACPERWPGSPVDDLLVRLDADTGEVRDARLPARGLRLSSLRPREAGGVLALATPDELGPVEVCGVAVTTEGGGRPDVVVAELE